MGTTVLVFEVELQKIHTIWISFDFEPGLGRYSKWHVSGRWEKRIEKYINTQFTSRYRNYDATG